MTRTTTGGYPDMKLVNSGAAAVDIGSTMHVAAVNPDICDTPVRAFGTFTQDLHDLAEWFQSCGVTSVAMEFDWRLLDTGLRAPRAARVRGDPRECPLRQERAGTEDRRQ